MNESFVVDANPLIAALLGGKAMEILSSSSLQFFSPQFTLFEVAGYLPRLAGKIGCTELQLLKTLERFPIKACQPSVYDGQMQRAMALIGLRDPDDAPVVALSLTLGHPIWTNDRDFDDLPGVLVVSTAQLVTYRPT